MLVVALALLACAYWRPHELDDFGSLGSFALTGTEGRTVTNQDLDGKVSVIACFFTCCTTSCPVLNASLARLQQELSDLNDLRLVSLTVDPEHDTPEKLAAYAQSFGAKPGRWLFLTGDQEKIESLVRDQLKQGLQRNMDPKAEDSMRYTHSPYLTLIDRRGHIRGWFDGTQADSIEQLKHAIRQLHG